MPATHVQMVSHVPGALYAVVLLEFAPVQRILDKLEKCANKANHSELDNLLLAMQ